MAGEAEGVGDLGRPGDRPVSTRNAGSGKSRSRKAAPASRLTARPVFGET